ncbi:pre-mrna-splicing factor 38b [Stemphylium lycopersici]|uniref:Pre-mrna-splicing factor 38b n=1 Tax=Stemphylium lycopersici TaxID=183478 RepID=A0A364NF56_STELY|nr:pre-mrna-splicing factor 38b [Stemphylium lycopersici]RAR10999.1 pre-mrna-splicing factor 38b [Stemphylium lycopersici]RAR15743.1 pre-mrna-splicing factor 38b [Stemphylium lycopersici]
MKSGAPKPNKNFLRHIIRQTDSHNAALLAKEAEESRARLRAMNRERDREGARDAQEKQRRADGRLTPVADDHGQLKRHPSRPRDHDDGDEDGYRRRRRSRERDGSNGASSRRHRERSRDSRRHKRRHDSDEDEDGSHRKRKRSRSPRERTHRHKDSDTEDTRRFRRREYKDGRHRRRGSYSRTASRSPSPHSRCSRHDKRREHRDRSAGDDTRSPHRNSDRHKHHRSSKRRAASPASDSDPLEAIVGPLPPPPEPTVRSKGRGALKPNSMGIEARFSSTYDPSVDVCAGSDVEDDWGDALEALRDRARWRQQGADRLKSAGFTDAQVRKWEKGDEQNEDDVVWKGRGQAREWDRGKVLDDFGDVELKADFGRLK